MSTTADPGWRFVACTPADTAFHISRTCDAPQADIAMLAATSKLSAQASFGRPRLVFTWLGAEPRSTQGLA
jgi:hypothetical protein